MAQAQLVMSALDSPSAIRRAAPWLWAAGGGLLAVALAAGAAAYLLSQTDELATLRGHDGVVRAVAFTADGEVLVSAGDDGDVRLWDARSNASLRTLEGHTAKVRAIAVAPGGSLLASVSDDHKLRLWNRDGDEAGSVELSRKPLECVAFSPDGKVVAAGGADNLVRVVRASDRQVVATLRGHSKHVHALLFLPDGKTLVTAADDGSVRLWDWASGKKPVVLTTTTHHVQAMAAPADGSSLAVAFTGLGVKRWELPSRQPLPALEGSGMVHGLAISADGTTLATTHEDRTVKLWDAANARLKATYKGHRDVVLAVAFAPDGATIATAAADGTVKRWRAR